jgi:hypothetical protein
MNGLNAVRVTNVATGFGSGVSLILPGHRPTFEIGSSLQLVSNRAARWLFLDPWAHAGKSWCREGEFIFWRPDFSGVIAKFGLINNFGVAGRTCFGPI